MQSMADLRRRALPVAVVLAALIYMTMGPLSVTAESATAQLSISAGSVSGNVNAAATVTRMIERFDAAPSEVQTCNAGGVPGTFWLRTPDPGPISYNATDDWMWTASTGIAPGVAALWKSRGGGFTAGTCADGPYSWSASDLNMTFAFKITNAGGTGVGMIVGFGESTAGSDWAGPVARFVYNSVNDSAAFAVCVFNNTFSCTASIWGLNNQQWYTVDLRYWSANTTTFGYIGGVGSRSLSATWSNEANLCCTVLGIRGGGGATESISGAVDNISVPQGRRGHWTSALQGSQNVQRIALTYALGLDTNGAGSTLGPFYANYSSGVNLWIRSTDVSSGSTFTLDQSTGTGGSFAAIVPQWSFAVRLVHEDGLAGTMTQLLSASVTYEIEESNSGLPLKWITPPVSLTLARVICDQGFLELHCRAELLANATGVLILQSLWYVDGSYSAEGQAGSSARIHVADLKVFAFPIRTANVTAQLLLTNDQTLILWGPQMINYVWILVIVGTVIVGIMIRELWRFSKSRPRRESG